MNSSEEAELLVRQRYCLGFGQVGGVFQEHSRLKFDLKWRDFQRKREFEYG